MKAAIIKGAGVTPAYGDFDDPAARPGQEIITVKAAALTHLTKGRASGEHYSSDNAYPNIAGVDGVGRTAVEKTWNADTGNDRVVFTTN
jgi:NADPH:quinone reductase-like Zn-dependent oxidoreductase